MFGSHLSIAGGLHNALLEAEKLGFTTTQIFTKNQQQWRVPRLDDAAVEQWKMHCTRLKFHHTISHNSYLINIASPDPVIWKKSVELLKEELRRCVALGIPYLVMHPGAHMGEGEKAGIKRIAKALDVVHRTVPGNDVLTCLEATAGQGSCLGHRLEHLVAIIEQVKDPERMGVCLDTAHLFAAGYDFRGAAYAGFRRELSRTVGIRRVKAWHINDSKKELGSRVDRHDHIGEGTIGLAGFRELVRDDAWANVPKILETPKDEAPDGRDWDLVNLERLRGLM